MIPLLWGAATAADDPTYDRLFAGEATPEAAPVEEGPAVPMWIWPASLLGLGLVGAAHLRRSVLKVADGGMRVVDRQALGDRSSLLVVEVLDAAGVKRRLLIGTGGGAPALVTDLGTIGAAVQPGAAPPLPPDPDALIEPELVDEPVLDAPYGAHDDPSPFAVNLAEEILAERRVFHADDDDDEAIFKTPYIAPLSTSPSVGPSAPRYFTDDDLAPVEDPSRDTPLPRVQRLRMFGAKFATARR